LILFGRRSIPAIVPKLTEWCRHTACAIGGMSSYNPFRRSNLTSTGFVFGRPREAPLLAAAGGGRSRSTKETSWRQIMPQRGTAMVRSGFALLAAATDAAAIMVGALLAAFLYQLTVYAEAPAQEAYLPMGAAIALLFIVPNIYKREYNISNYVSLKGHLGSSFVLWNVAFASAIALGFMTKTTEIFSRGTMILYYLAGWGILALARLMLVGALRRTNSARAVSAPRIFLVGHEDQVLAFSRLCELANSGPSLVAAAILRSGEETLEDDLKLATASARMLLPDDIFILVPWSERRAIDACLDAFLQVPASIHLGPERVLDRFMDAHISKVAPVASLQLVRRPLSLTEVIVKRVFDLVLASVGLVLLAPLFLVIAVLIKLDSKGPVFFLQRRYGFNQKAFRIVKFRSMTTLDDGAEVRQAGRNDVRVTRVGRFLRRWNLDELPQLINVVKGDMSLVGPRPHALAHNQHYEQRIALYARRHNVKPGITGWAQVNGFRGETATDDRMRSRVEFDLQYIDDWSLWLDLRILAMTLSPKAFTNAY
jgi:Undecaprenyl-phosphate glucose phosphotransferase